MIPATYTFFSDPGHGWLCVPRAELNALGIANKVSRYSYQYRDYVLLEEDCDMPLFLNAMRAAGTPIDNERIREQFQDPTPVCNYTHYVPA